MLDNLFLDFILSLQNLPNLLVSGINLIICLVAVSLASKHFGYAGLCGYMVLSSVIANIQVLYATSYEILNMEVLLGTVVFCSSFLACDLINLKYGPQKAKQAVYLTIFTDIFFLLNIILTLSHKPLDYGQYAEFSVSKETILGNVAAIKQIFLPIPRLLVASYVSYLCSQLCEIWLLNFIKEKLTFLRHNLILFISNVCLDTLVFTFIGFCLLSSESLSFKDFKEICGSAIIIRILCNIVNIWCAKLHKS